MLDNSQLIFAATESKIYAKEFDPILESTRSDIPPLFVYLQRLHNLSAMMWMPLFLILLPLAADGWHFRRHRKAYRYRNLLLTLVAAGDLLPLAGIVLFWLVKDNTGGVVTAAMWIFFAYLLLTLPRMAYYAVRAFGKGRATRILAPIAALGMAGVLIHGAVSGRSTLAVHRVTLRSDRLPEAFDGRARTIHRPAHRDARRPRPRDEGAGRLAQRSTARSGDLLRRSGQHPLHGT